MEKGIQRRQEILRVMSRSQRPLSGAWLAEHFSVSRQVIVQDIALIRAAGKDVISTNRGYLLNVPLRISCRIKCHHTDEQITDELYTIVDLGGAVEDVSVNHKVYGRLCAPMEITSRRDVDRFLETLRSGVSSPLKSVTSGYHYHTISAENQETLDLIQKTLREKGYLCPPDEETGIQPS